MKLLYAKSLIDHFQLSGKFYHIITDLKGKFIHTNSLFEKNSGYTSAQLSFLFLYGIIDEEQTGHCRSVIKHCLDHAGETSSVELLCRRQDGSYIKICWELSVIMGEDQPLYIQWIGVEEQNSAGQQLQNSKPGLQQSELFYRNLIADSLDGILLTNADGMITFASASVTKILKYPPGELLGKNAFEFLHPEDRHLGISTFFNELERSPESKFINVRLRTKPGDWLWCMVRGHNMLLNPHVSAMLIYFSDDTVRRNTEAALIESERRFRHLIHNLNLGVILVSPTGEVLILNQATIDMFEFTEKPTVGRNMLQTSLEIIHEDGTIFLAEDFPVALAIKNHQSYNKVVMGINRSNGRDRLWLLVSAEPILDDNDNVLYVISSFTDISEQKSLANHLVEQEIQKQKQLMQATIDGQENERREIGRELHDNISQHLTTTRLYLEVAKEKADGELLKMINQAHKGMLDIVTEIRHLSQSLVPPSLSDIGLIESIQDLSEPLKNTHAFAIEFNYDHFDEAQLPENMKLMLFRIIQEQVNNIIRHAQANTMLISLENNQSQVTLLVKDNGRGFDPATIKKGLGLDNISNRAGLFGGKLQIDTAPGKGTTVRVTIPL